MGSTSSCCLALGLDNATPRGATARDLILGIAGYLSRHDAGIRARAPATRSPRPHRAGARWPWRHRPPRWRSLLCGALFVVSAHNSEGTDLRPGRYTDLASLVVDRGPARTRPSAAGWPGLNAEVETAGRTRSSDREVRRLPAARPNALRGPGRADPVHRARPSRSPSPTRPRRSSTPPPSDLNLLVVHQQDIQAVVNAMWKGGARGGDRPGPADRHHHRHQVRGQRGPARTACPTPSPT